GASGVGPLRATTTAQDQGALEALPFTPEGQADHFQGKVQLVPGRNRVSIFTSDIVGNVGQVEVVIEYSPGEFEHEPVETLSYRLDIDCVTSTGSSTSCRPGTITDLSSSMHGQAVAFSSEGNQFVQNDTNGVEDVFLWRDG